MDEVGGGWSVLAIIAAAIIAAAATAVTSRWANRNERIRLRQELIEIRGGDRQRLTDELEKVRARANEVDAELEKVRDERRTTADEYAAARIAHREALADQLTAHRQSLAEREVEHRQALAERDSQQRELGLTLQQVQGQLDTCSRELASVQQELTNRGEMIRAQGQIIADYRARYPDLRI